MQNMCYSLQKTHNIPDIQSFYAFYPYWTKEFMSVLSYAATFEIYLVFQRNTKEK